MKNQKSLLLVVLLSFGAFNLFAQKEIPAFDSYHKNIYFEFLGSSILTGASYDMRLEKGRMDGMGFRAGVGGLSISDNGQSAGLVTFPLEFNYVVGKRKSSLISGVGLLPAYASLSGQGDFTENEYVEAEGFGLAGGFLTFGYRLQPRKTGFMMQVIWNPLILRKSGFNAGWFGIGLGIGFK